MVLYLSLFSIGVSILLAIYNWKINRNAILLSGIFIIFSTYTLTHHFTVYSDNDYWLAIFYGNLSPLWYLPGPLLYFYVRSTITDKKAINSWKDGIHFIPFLIHFANSLPYISLPFSEKLAWVSQIHTNLNVILNNPYNWLYSTSIAFITRPSLVIIYSLVCFKLLLKQRKKVYPENSTTENQIRISYKWLYILVSCLLVVCLGFLFLIIELMDQDITRLAIESKFAHLFSGVVIFLLPTCLILFFPKVLYGMPEPIHTNKAKLKKNNSQKEELDENDPFKEVAEEIIQYIQTEKPFINPDFQIADLSFALQIPQHHIAYCFTSILDTKFTSYRTTLRVEYAKELLREGLTDSLSIDGIGAKAGFPSRSSFYASFKSETGMTPSQYLESL